MRAAFALRIFSGKNIYNCAIPGRLRSARNRIFTGGVVKGNGICKKSPHDTDLKSKRQQGQLVGGFGRYSHTAPEGSAVQTCGYTGSIF